MLKIKEGIDLKELEKYGFKEIDDLGVINYCYSKGDSELVINSSRNIYIDIDCECWLNFDLPNEILNVVYDLIKADLVEKVNE